MSLESNYPEPAEIDFKAAGKEYHYDLRLEIGLDDSVEGIAINAVFVDFLRTMTAVVDHDLKVTDVKDNPVDLNNPPDGEEFKKNFCVEPVEGKKRKIFLGFRLTTVTPMSVLKYRMFRYLREKQMFLRVHTGGYQHGINSVFLGYLREENPSTADVNMWQETILKEINAVWRNNKLLTDDIRKSITQKFPRQATKNKISFPINIEKGKLVASHSNGKKIETNGLLVSTPKQFIEPVKQLLDGVLFDTKKIANFVPAAMRKESPDVYYSVMVSHAKYVHHHRNIQIRDIHPLLFDKDIKPTLMRNTKILRIYVDKAKSRANISTTEQDFRETCDWIDQQLERLPLPYKPFRFRKDNGSSGTGKTGRTNYAKLFTEDNTIASDNSSFDPSTIKTNRSNAWNKRLPLKIAYTINDEAFPPLLSKTSPASNPATATVLTEPSDNLEDMISAAIQKVEKANEERMASITATMNQRLTVIEQSISTMVEKVVEATYRSLMSSGTFVTREENLQLQTEVGIMSKKLDALLEVIQLRDSTPVNSPPRKNPRFDGTESQSSALLICDAMSERED